MIFGRNRKKGQTSKSGHRAPTPQRGVPSSRRGRGAILVRYDVSLLRRGVDTVH